MRKYSYEFVKNYFTQYDCKLLSNEYKNVVGKLEYICSCGNINRTSFSHFMTGNKKCKYCRHKHSYEYIYNYFKENNCTLLDKEYKNNHQKLNYICSCGNKHSKTFNSFQTSPMCNECGMKKRKTRLIPYDDIYQLFLDEGCLLLILKENYKGMGTKVEFICSCGNQSTIKVSDFKNGHRCFGCYGKKRFTYEEVKQFFKENNAILLSTEYINTEQSLEYICLSCGEKRITSFKRFKRGERCAFCAHKRNSGENHARWNGGVSTLTEYLRSKITKWKLDSLKEYGYKCVLTGEKFDVIHHAYGFHKIFDELILITNTPLYSEINQYSEEQLKILGDKILELHYKYGFGIPLKKEIHNLFHRLYGKKDNSQQQFEEFKNNYLSGRIDHFFISKEAI